MKKSFNWRIFISFGFLLAFLILLVSGLVLYISPPGRVANWTDWRILGLTKRGWENQHTVFSFAFAILSVFHLFVINWNAFLSYLKTKTTQGLKSPKELLASSILFLVFAAGTMYAVQPFSAIIDFGNRISESWEEQDRQPPVPHAEAITLVELALGSSGLGGDAEALKTKLTEAGFSVSSVDETLAEIAERNNTIAEKLYRHIAPEKSGKSTLPAKGLGRKTLQKVADSAGISAVSLQLALRQQDIDAELEMTLKAIADRNRISMSELRELLESMLSR